MERGTSRQVCKVAFPALQADCICKHFYTSIVRVTKKSTSPLSNNGFVFLFVHPTSFEGTVGTEDCVFYIADQ